MNNTTFSFDQLSDSGSVDVQEGQNKLTIIDAKEIVASTGTLMLQLAYKINDSELKLNYDNCPMITADRQKIPFGEHKLKNIMIATNVRPQHFTLKTLCPLLLGKSFLADIAKNEKGYWTLPDPNTIVPLDYANETQFEAEKIVPRPAPRENYQSVIGEEEVELDIQPQSTNKW